MDLVFNFNVIEAGIWALFALIVALPKLRSRGMTPRLRASFVLLFLAFAISDLWEASTGAWWRPPALLVYKGVCLMGLAACGRLFWRRRRDLARQHIK
jgi:hypothetical protein